MLQKYEYEEAHDSIDHNDNGTGLSPSVESKGKPSFDHEKLAESNRVAAREAASDIATRQRKINQNTILKKDAREATAKQKQQKIQAKEDRRKRALKGERKR